MMRARGARWSLGSGGSPRSSRIGVGGRGAPCPGTPRRMPTYLAGPFARAASSFERCASGSFLNSPMHCLQQKRTSLTP